MWGENSLFYTGKTLNRAERKLSAIHFHWLSLQGKGGPAKFNLLYYVGENNASLKKKKKKAQIQL